jgi:hypothetical protein
MEIPMATVTALKFNTPEGDVDGKGVISVAVHVRFGDILDPSYGVANNDARCAW